MKYREIESSILEFKQQLPKNEQIIKTVVGFCNQNGGKLIIGVADDGSIKGMLDSEIQKTLEYLDKSIFESTTPPIMPLIYAQRFGEKTVLIIEVSKGMNRPYYIRAEGQEKGVYIRLGRSTLRANKEMIEELQWQSRGLTFDKQPVYQASLEDLCQEKLKVFFHKKSTLVLTKSAWHELLCSYDIISMEHSHIYPTVAGILLFGKTPQKFFSEGFIISTHFKGINGRESIASKDCTGTVVEQFDEAFSFLLSRLNKSFSIQGKKRIENLEIPEIAIREILINAIAHRNYHINGPSKIAIYPNRIEIFTPGSFPGPINAQNITHGLTYIRNIAICRILRQMGFIEKLGSGFITTFDAFARANLPEPQVVEGENFVKCILPRPGLNSKKNSTLEGNLKRIIKLFERGEEFSIGDIIEVLKIPRSTTGRLLDSLILKGFIQRLGKGKGSRYKLI